MLSYNWYIGIINARIETIQIQLLGHFGLNPAPMSLVSELKSLQEKRACFIDIMVGFIAHK